ncbi:hypothetical protein LTS18_009456 [Coniosporium uncinatum]|uniref:Uncharacterized protein n=1 Tax=Coniosporium uncinatum TaxID=93489 RepID=A0ACC3D0H4_9PEZI|nr:hypothetical protein LTS18_009456 [Coniosporium uncinatum]
MAKTKPSQRSKKNKKSKGVNGASKPNESPEVLLAQSQTFLQQSELEQALVKAQKALALLQPSEEPTIVSLPALMLCGEICVELGDIDTARDYFSVAAVVDPEGGVSEEAGGGAEKFFWLAQLSEEGGQESVGCFEQGADVLRKQIGDLEGRKSTPEIQTLLSDKRRKLANALCGIAEIYMTDLSWDDAEAEEQCNRATTEALLIAPDVPETLQTIASVRISQNKRDEAREYLGKSLNLWKDLDLGDTRVPDFPTRISLARLLMEAEMEDEAMEVLERLVSEDDSSIEAWYLGGWCQHLMAEKQTQEQVNGSSQAQDVLKRSRRWLSQCLKLYQLLDYEDDRLREHADELVAGLNKILGEPLAEWEEGDDDEDWEDEEDSSGDEVMNGT